jgi:hypothetical protein
MVRQPLDQLISLETVASIPSSAAPRETMAIDPTSRKTTALGCLLRIVFGLFVLAVIVGGGGSFYVMREFHKNRAALNAEVQRIRSLGEPLGGAELNAYCQIPAGEADLTEVYLAALAPLIGDRRPLPEIGKTGIRDLDLDSVPLRPIAWELLEEAEQHLAQREKLLSDLVAAGKLRGSVRYPVDFQQGTSLKYEMPMVVNDAKDLLFLRAVCQYQRGDFEGATDTIVATVRLGETLRLDPSLMSQLIRQVAYDRAASMMVRLTADPDFPASGIARIQDVLSAGNLDDAFLRSSIGERVMAYQALQLPLDQLTGSGGATSNAPSIGDSRPGDSAMLLHLRSLHVETGKLPWDQGLAANLANRDEIVAERAADEKRLLWNRNVVTTLAGASSTPFYETMLRSEAQRRSAVTICATERFRRERGTLPTLLTELVPDFLDAVPTDPANRQSLRYLRTQAGYKVYGVGVNQRDDGGDFGNSRDAADFGYEVLLPAGVAPHDKMP